VRLCRALHERRAPPFQVGPQRTDGGLADRHQPLLRALPARPQHALVDVHVHQLEPDRLRCAQPARVHHLEERAVAQRGRLGAAWLGEQLLDLSAREHVRQLSRAPRRAQRGGGVGVEEAVAAQVAVEAAQAGALAVDRRGRCRAAGWRVAVRLGADRQLLEKVRHIGRCGVERGQLALLEEAAVLQQVGAVRVQRVTRQASLELEVGEEVEHQVLEPALDGGLFDRGHACWFGRAAGIP
jgi:hypothetical protein